MPLSLRLVSAKWRNWSSIRPEASRSSFHACQSHSLPFPCQGSGMRYATQPCSKDSRPPFAIDKD